MHLSHTASLLALWAIAPAFSQSAPLLTPQALEDLVNRENLLNHATQFLAFSELSNGTRAFGSKGHDATIRYIKGLLDETGYYDTEFEEFVYSYSEATAQFSANGQSYPTKGLGYAPSGEVTGPVVVVNNLGCEAVSAPPSSFIARLTIPPTGRLPCRCQRQRRTHPARDVRPRLEGRTGWCSWRCRFHHLQQHRR